MRGRAIRAAWPAMALSFHFTGLHWRLQLATRSTGSTEPIAPCVRQLQLASSAREKKLAAVFSTRVAHSHSRKLRAYSALYQVAHRLRCTSHTLKAPVAFGESIKRGIGGFTIAGHMEFPEAQPTRRASQEGEHRHDGQPIAIKHRNALRSSVHAGYVGSFGSFGANS